MVPHKDAPPSGYRSCLLTFRLLAGLVLHTRRHTSRGRDHYCAKREGRRRRIRTFFDHIPPGLGPRRPEHLGRYIRWDGLGRRAHERRRALKAVVGG